MGRGNHRRLAAHQRAPASTLTSTNSSQRPGKGTPGPVEPRPPGPAAGASSYPSTKIRIQNTTPDQPAPAINPYERSGLTTRWGRNSRRSVGPNLLTTLIWAALKNYVANTAVSWPGRLRPIHSFFRTRSPDQMLATAAPWTSPWLPPGYEQNYWNAASLLQSRRYSDAIASDPSDQHDTRQPGR